MRWLASGQRGLCYLSGRFFFRRIGVGELGRVGYLKVEGRKRDGVGGERLGREVLGIGVQGTKGTRVAYSENESKVK